MEIIVVENLGKRLGGDLYLGAMSFCVQSGEILGVTGPKGCGKTTLLRLLWGFTRPDVGSVRVFGLRPHLEQLKVRKSAGYLSEDPLFYDRMTPPQFLKFIGNFYETWDRRWVSELLQEFEIPAAMQLWEISSAERAKLGLIAAIGHRPSLLIMDDPTFDLHPMVRSEFLHFVKTLARKEKMTVVLSSRTTDNLSQMTDSILQLEHGRIVEYSLAAHLVEKHNAH